MRKVLIIAADFYPSNTGFSNATLGLINSISDFADDIQIHVFTTVPLGNNNELENIPVVRYQAKHNYNKISSFFNKIAQFNFIKSYVSKNEIDFLLLETNIFTFLQLLLCDFYKEKLAVRIHSTIDTEVLIFEKPKNLYQKFQKTLDIQFMKKASNIISTNKYHINFIKEYFYNNNVYTIWDNKDYYILPNTSSPIDNIDNLTPDDYLMTMGKLSSNGYIQKGLKDLIKAVYHLKKSDELPYNFHLKIVGDGDMYDKITKYAITLGVSNHIEFIKYLTHEESITMIKKAKAIILLSRYEGQSMFITEALSLSKPLIITNDNGMCDMIINGKNGFSLNSGDYLAAAESIKKIYACSIDELTSMELESYKLYQERFSPQRISKNFEGILDLILKIN